MTDKSPQKPATRRRLLKVFGAVGATGLGGGWLLTPRGANAYYSGPVSDHFDGVRFFNEGQQGPKSIAMLLRWQLTEKSASWPSRYPGLAAAKPSRRLDAGQMRVTYIGHASFLLQACAANILIDPVYADRAGPFALLGPKRVNAPGIAFDDLPPIDAVLITHNHYDHMDTATLGRLWERDKPEFITPLGNDAILADAIPGLAARAGDWGDRITLRSGITVHVEPTQHWSARGTRDRMHALWASFVIEAGGRKVYAIGDTGFGDGNIFRQVATRHPSIDLALIPIGAYEPRWFMWSQHINPADAVEVLALSGARVALGHHWGTFKLTNEAIDDPPRHLAEALAAKRIAPERFTALRPGEMRQVE